MNIRVVGIDIAKSVFQGCVLLHDHRDGSLRTIPSLGSTNAEVWIRGHVNS